MFIIEVPQELYDFPVIIAQQDILFGCNHRGNIGTPVGRVFQKAFVISFGEV